MPRESSIVRGRRRSNLQVTCCRSRERFRNKGGKRTPGGLERTLKMQWLNPDEGQRRSQGKQARSPWTAGHTGAEVKAHGAENGSNAAGHVFATVLADSFDNGNGAAVAYGEALAGLSRDVELAGGSAVKNGIAYEHVAALRSVRARADDDGAAREAFADVVVSFADEFQGKAGSEESAEALTRGAMKFARSGGCGLVPDLLAHAFATEVRADTAMKIIDGGSRAPSRLRVVEEQLKFWHAGIQNRCLLRQDAASP